MKFPADTIGDKHDQEPKIPYNMKEKTLDVTPKGYVDENRNLFLLNRKCDNREKGWAFDSNLKPHKRVYHAKVTQVQPVMKKTR